MGLIAITGGLAIVGSGFSAWYFQADELEGSHTVNHYVTDLNAGIGTLADNNKGQNLYVIFDQGGYANKDNVVYGLSINDVAGTVSDKNLGTKITAIGATYSIALGDYTTLHDAGVTKGVFTATLTLSQAAQKYVAFKNGYDLAASGLYNATDDYSSVMPTLTNDGNAITYSYVVDFTKEQSADVKRVFGFNAATTDGVNALLQYKAHSEDGGKPTSKDEYEAMKTDLGSDPLLTAEYTFNVNE